MPARARWTETVHFHLLKATIVAQSLHLVEDSVTVRKEMARREVLLVDDVRDIHAIDLVDCLLQLAHCFEDIIFVMKVSVGCNVLFPSRGVRAFFKPSLQMVVLVHSDKIFPLQVIQKLLVVSNPFDYKVDGQLRLFLSKRLGASCNVPQPLCKDSWPRLYHINDLAANIVLSCVKKHRLLLLQGIPSLHGNYLFDLMLIPVKYNYKTRASAS